jgi:urease accessory protein UreF
MLVAFGVFVRVAGFSVRMTVILIVMVWVTVIVGVGVRVG